MAKNKRKILIFRFCPESEKAQFSLNIFNILKTEKAPSVAGIGEGAGITEDIVAEYINSCVKKDLLKISGAGKGGLVKFNDDQKKIVGIGFSKEECILTVIGLDGEVVARERIPVGSIVKLKGRNKEIKQIVEEIGSMTKLSGIEMFCAGVAVPEKMAELNAKSGQILAEGISHIFKCDVFLAMEATAAGYGEKDVRGKAGDADVLYMHSDIGRGVVIKDEMIFEAGETVAEGEKAYLRPWSQFSIVATAKNLVNKGVGTDIVNMVNGEIDSITLGVVMDAAEKRDELAEDLVKRSGLALGVRAAYLVNMFDPAVVILGGGTEKKEGNFTGFVKESAGRFLLKDKMDKMNIIPGVLGVEASSMGAASLCRRELFMEV